MMLSAAIEAATGFALIAAPALIRDLRKWLKCPNSKMPDAPTGSPVKQKANSAPQLHTPSWCITLESRLLLTTHSAISILRH